MASSGSCTTLYVFIRTSMVRGDVHQGSSTWRRQSCVSVPRVTVPRRPQFVHTGGANSTKRYVDVLTLIPINVAYLEIGFLQMSSKSEVI